MSEKYFFSYNSYLQGKFGQRVQRLPLDPGFGCPNLDGTLSQAGCIYCDNKAFSPNAQSPKALESQIQSSIEFYRARMGVGLFIAYFQAFSGTHTSVQNLDASLRVVRKFPEIVGISLSTRPDLIDSSKLEVIASWAREYLVWIEYGLQTTDNKGLVFLNRNHSFEDFTQALSLTRSFGINTAVHMILGLPSYGSRGSVNDFKRLSTLDVQGAKFHLLHVLKNTELARLYAQGEISLMQRVDYVRCVCDCLELISPDVVIMRLISSASRDFLIAPPWMNQRQQIKQEIEKEFIRRGTCQGSKYEVVAGKSQ